MLMKTILLTTTILFFQIFVISQSPSGFESSEDYWELIKDQDDIKVFINKQNCEFACVRVHLYIHVNLELYFEYINDVENYKEWIYACIESKELYRNDDVLVAYTITDMPFPFYDRILTLESKQHFNPKHHETRSNYVPSHNPENKYVEISHFRNKWVVKEITPSLIKIEYEVETEPGGLIPSWLYILGVDIGPYNSLNALKINLEKLQKQQQK